MVLLLEDLIFENVFQVKKHEKLVKDSLEKISLVSSKDETELIISLLYKLLELEFFLLKNLQ